MIENQRHEILALFQSRTAIFNADECMKILEQFQWDCLEAINYVIENIDSIKEKSSNFVEQTLNIYPSLIPDEYLNEVECIRHFERVFQDRHPNVRRWPVWFKSSLENAINQSHGPFAIFLNHDKSTFTNTFSCQILCSPSILNVFTTYQCILWPWDITYPLNKQRLLDKSGRARQILFKCFSYFNDVNSYPLLLILSRQKDRIVLLDIINGNCDFDQTRACLERTLNPMLEESIISSNETTFLSPGWVGGRTVGNIHRRPSFITTFRLSRSLRVAQRPRYISFYKPKVDTPEIIVTMQEAQQWLKKKNTINNPIHYSNSSNYQQQCQQMNLSCTEIDISSFKRNFSPVPSLSVSNKDQFPLIYMSPRRAGWAPLFHR